MRWIVGLGLLGCLAACGNDESAESRSAPLPTVAETSDIHVESAEKGPNPFIYQVNLAGQRLPAVKTISCVIEPKPGTVSKPVRVMYTLNALKERGRFPTKQLLQVPLFGLYANYANQIAISIGFADGSAQQLSVTAQTDAFADTTGMYLHPTFVKKRAAGSTLGFDFMVLKSNVVPPLIIDTDGEVRWIAPGSAPGNATALLGNDFIIGDLRSAAFNRVGLDGGVTTVPLANQSYLHFHHNIDPGKLGLLGEFDTAVDFESIIAEFDPNGGILKEWNFAQILTDYMTAHGDDPTQFVRHGIDWFHSNAATYDPRDDSVLVSSRENFIVKVDRESGEIRWIFGDPTKYWATFPSLRAKSLTLDSNGLYPVGEHGISINRDGLLMLFNNGYRSLHQPPGAPEGLQRSYSPVAAYRIDDAHLTATEEWRFDYDQSISSLVCSSAYDTADRSLLINYAWADLGAHARIVGLDPGHAVVFDIQYDNVNGGCDASWNALPIALENVVYE